MQAPAECSFQHALLLPAPPPALCEGELKAQSDTSDRPGMEEKETGDTTTTSEPVLDPQQCAEQTDLLSLIISGEEEATQEEIDLGHCCSAGEEEGLTNGHTEDDSHGDMVTPISSPQTSYWSVTEDPDQPLLLSAIAGPSGQKPPRVQRASRPGLSRIPGRDHRRYYHEYWRGEYLMDFDPRRHGMICMVCGSSLATLKLSTIKRHIRQKHPDSLLWSTADKEVIRSGWESHLSLRPFGSPADEPPPLTEDQLLDSAQRPVEHLDAMTPQHHPHQPPSMSPASMAGAGGEDPPQQPRKEEEEEEEAPPAGPSAQTLERYLNDSLHAWFRQEFLMEYEAEPGRLVCMVCGAQLPSLHLDHIKSHVLDTHPNSLVYSSEEKHCILQAWAQTHEESDDFIKSESNTKDTGDAGVHLYPALNDMEAHRMNSALHPQGEEEGALTQDTGLIGEDGMTGIRPAEQPLRKLKSPRPRKRRLLGGNPWRLRLDYMVAYGPQGRGTYCMVCSQALTEAKVCTFRTHIQNCHPETITLTRQEREAMAAAWTKYYPAEGTQIKQEVTQSETTAFDAAAGEIKEQTCSPTAETPSKMVKREEGAEEDTSVSGEKGKAKEAGAATATPARHSHYPGKDQRRNYQVRWRMEFLMDYDCRRHGLICMVCGATLATLKVSTIKRHIQQVHPHSLYYGPDEKQQALQSYNQTALHFIHSDDCFSSQDHGYTAPEQTLGQLEQTLGQLEQTLGQTLGQLCAAPEEEQTPGQLYNSALVQTPEQFGT